MAITVTITLTTAGADTGPFSLYSNIDGYLVAFETGVPKASLEAGYLTSLVPDSTETIRVLSESVLCTNYVNLVIGGTPPTTTTTTTVEPTTTTTTTTCALTPDSLAVGNDLETMCEEACGTLYTGGEVIADGSLIYVDCDFTPLTGYSYIRDCDTGEIFNLNPINGQVGSSVSNC